MLWDLWLFDFSEAKSETVENIHDSTAPVTLDKGNIGYVIRGI